MIQVKDFTKDGKCSRCGCCCTDFLPMTPKELQTIQEYVLKHDIQNQRPRNPMLANPPIDCMCPFQKDGGGCVIYEVRPAVCRNFICSMPIPKIAKDREYYLRRGKPYSLRYEIFGDESNLCML